MTRLLAVLVVFLALTFAHADLRVGFIDRSAPGEPGARDAAALAYARTQGTVTRLRPGPGGGWEAPGDRTYAPEEFDVIWYHEGDTPAASLGDAAHADLLAYVEGGGALLLSGSAGNLVSELGFETTPPRVLGPTSAAYLSGIVVPPQHRAHPIFAGLDVTRPVILTSLGGNALTDFYATAAPHGEVLADGTAGLGERPLVEYSVGAGRVIMVGWRLPDFTTAGDPYRPNIERLFGNMLRYLAAGNTNHARLIPPAGKAAYVRLLGVPFLRCEHASVLAVSASALSGEAGPWKSATLLEPQTSAGALPAGDAFVVEAAPPAAPVQALALTLTSRERPAAQYLATRQAEQAEQDRQDAEMMKGLRVMKPQVTLTPGPLKPLRLAEPEQAILLGHSPFMAPAGDIQPAYEPLEDGGFRIEGSFRRQNRPIVHGQNRVWTGDAPVFMVDAPTGSGCYAEDRIFPLFPRPDASRGDTGLCLGALRLAVPGPDGAPRWLDEMKAQTTFRPGYTQYVIAEPAGAWHATLTMAPLLDSHGFVCRVEFDRETPLRWQYGGIWWTEGEANKNAVAVDGRVAFITEPNLPNGLVGVGCDAAGELKAVPAPYGRQVQFTAAQPARVYHVVSTWGVTTYDQARADKTMARLDTPNTAAWPQARDRLKRAWFDAYIGRALEPEKRLRALVAAPQEALDKTVSWWDQRRAQFQIRTPDRRLNALINWSRATTEYHRQGPGLVLGAQIWQMYSHISTGWYGKEWGGDHAAMEECLRLYGAMQEDNGFIRWISPSLMPFDAEDNTPYWVDQVWRHYTWTGDLQFIRDLWPAVRKAVAWMRKTNDPTDSGLFRDWYEYWNCDSNGKGPKSVVPSAMSWAMMDRAARMAALLGDPQAEKEYRALADRTREAVLRELWREDKGRLGCIGAEGIWRGHPQTWEEYLPVNCGLLSPDQGRRALRWLAGHYGFQPQPGVQLLSCSDWYPIRWSCQWVPTGDTCLAALAGMKCGDADLWWPYLRTVVGSAFASDFPGINMGISNAGAGGGDREDVDSVDPHCHAVVRGLFGLEPALHEGRLDICPAFPSDWTEAGITTPDLSYQWRRTGEEAELRIHTPKPTVKHVRANLTGPEVVTPAETDSTVRVRLGPVPPPPEPTPTAPVPAPGPLGTRLARGAPEPETATPATWAPAVKGKLVLFDLTGAYNKTVEEFVATPFIYDCSDGPSPIAGWWGNPGISLPPTPRVLEAPGGVRFLTAGRPKPGAGLPGKNLLALSSWRPYPLPGGATIPVGLQCRRVWLLMQNYVHPMKNYIPNGEVILHYADGRQALTSLIPPYNLDCYFQHFSLQGVSLPLGRLSGGGFVDMSVSQAHALALPLPCGPGQVLESVELRATCSEGALGLLGLTAELGP